MMRCGFVLTMVVAASFVAACVTGAPFGLGVFRAIVPYDGGGDSGGLVTLGHGTGNADKVDDFHAYGTRTANALLALDGSKHFPVDVIADASITGTKIKDGSITGIDVKPGAITWPRLADGAVDAVKLAYHAVTADRINASGLAADKYLKYTGSSLVWADCSGGFSLPYSGSMPYDGCLFSITNTGKGQAGSFSAQGEEGQQVENFALRAWYHGRNGNAGQFRNCNVSNTGAAVLAENVGLGMAGHFTINKADSTSDALKIETDGKGRALSATSTGNSAQCVAWIGLNNQNSAATPLMVWSSGTGSAGWFNNFSGSPTVDAQNGGTGWAARFTGKNGVYASTTGGPYAGQFIGNVDVQGIITKTECRFKIDHPLDPEDMYLEHSCVESSETLNVYSGNVPLDARGEAWIALPDWFEALNCDFRYQLTPIGAPAPGLYIAQEIQDGCFCIAGGQPGVKVSWQVTGVRQDPYALAHPLEVEVEKPEAERGYYLHPEVYSMPDSMGIDRVTGSRPVSEMH